MIVEDKGKKLQNGLSGVSRAAVTNSEKIDYSLTPSANMRHDSF